MNNPFTIDFPISNTNDGKFVIPDTVNRVMFDIGASYHAPNTKKNLNKETFIALVEPDPRMWLSYLSAWYHTQELPKGKNPYHLDDAIEPEFFNNFSFLPCAIGRENGFFEYNLCERDGKSSLLELNPEFPNNHNPFQKIPVKVITLNELIDMVQEDRRIDMIKLDCQGYDEQVILSGKENLERVDFLAVEVNEHESNQYIDSYDVSGFSKTLDECGFTHISNSGGQEIFANKETISESSYNFIIQ